MLAVVRADIKHHEINSFKIPEHKTSYMEQARQIDADVCSRQSLDVDTVSGATLTSDTLFKSNRKRIGIES